MESFNENSYPIRVSHVCTDSFVNPEDDCLWDEDDKWLECPRCELKPKVWTFDNGQQTACGCGIGKYDHFSVRAESIMSVHSRNHGNLSEYDNDALRKEWNKYCRGEDYITHEKLREMDRH